MTIYGNELYLYRARLLYYQSMYYCFLDYHFYTNINNFDNYENLSNSLKIQIIISKNNLNKINDELSILQFLELDNIRDY